MSDDALDQVTEAVKILLLGGYKDAERAAIMMWGAHRNGQDPVATAKHLVRLREAIRQ